MNILLTNDDGISAYGIKSLYETFREKHDVYIIAPVLERSGCSSAITMDKHLKIDTISHDKYAVHGFTADCVNIGLKGNIIPKVDLVISGINHGPNCGDDIYFSGTVAGARVAYIYGIPGISISLDSFIDSPNFKQASLFLLDFIEKSNILSEENTPFLNINYPDVPKDEIQGIKYTKLGKREYRDSYKLVQKDKKQIRLEFTGGITTHAEDETDINYLKEGFISITPLQLDCTDYDRLDYLMNKSR